MERVALVTGASSGIGWAIANRLQMDGFALSFHGRCEDDEPRARFAELAASGTVHSTRAPRRRSG